jgi:hypothetical protein
MVTYKGVNGEPSCENEYLLANVVRKDRGFRDFVLSHWMQYTILLGSQRPAWMVKSHRLPSVEKQCSRSCLPAGFP